MKTEALDLSTIAHLLWHWENELDHERIAARFLKAGIPKDYALAQAKVAYYRELQLETFRNV